jgi:hypothetical protein
LEYAENVSTKVIEAVEKLRTTTTINSITPSSGVIWQSATVDITVAPAEDVSTNLTPSGDVTLSANTGESTTCALGTGGTASCTLTINHAGTITLTASYGGELKFEPSATTQSYTVAKANSSTTISSSSNPAAFEDSLTFTAGVSGSGGTPTGSVSFKDGTTTLGSATLDGSGNATFSTAALSVGTHSISAEYSGDANFNSSTSSALAQSVRDASSGLLGDVSCNDKVNVYDGLYILQYDVGLRSSGNNCPRAGDEINIGLCDVNSNGKCNVYDALYILQCDVGISNVLCPTSSTSRSALTLKPSAPNAATVTIGDHQVALNATVDVPVTANVDTSTPMRAAKIEVTFDSKVEATSCTAPEGGSCNPSTKRSLLIALQQVERPDHLR